MATYRTDGWTALGDPTRRAIFELAGALPVSRPAVSQHLKVLKAAGLVLDRPAGTRRIYQLDPDGVDALRAYLDQFWNQALAAYKEAVEQPTHELEQGHDRPGCGRWFSGAVSAGVVVLLEQHALPVLLCDVRLEP